MRVCTPKTASLLLITVIMMLYSAAFADYHYVSHSGSNEYPYISWETAADSITYAINAAEPFDTIYIASGSYDELVRMAQADSCITFIGAGVDSTHVWSSIYGHLWEVSDQTVVQDIWFEQNNANRACYYALYFDASLIARHCKFSSTAVGTGAISGEGDSAIVENCEFNNFMSIFDALITIPKFVFRNNYMRSTSTNVVLEADWSWGTIENNILLATGGAPNFSEPADYNDSSVFRNNYLDHLYRGYQANAPLTCSIENNTTRVSGYGSLVFYNNPGDSGLIAYRNNAFTESEYGISAGLGLPDEGYESLYVAYNDFWNNSVRDIYIARWGHIDSINNITAFPMYVNPDSFDVHLQAYSPFIDAGDPNILDVDGTRSDIGCYGGPGGCSYVYLDLAPQIPDSISAFRDSISITLTWRRNYEADFNRYQIFRDTISGFSPSVFNMIAEPETAFYADSSINRNQAYYFRLTAVDNQRNVSDFSDEIAVIPTSIPPFDDGNGMIPRYTTITIAYPNPFNSNITIVYSASNLGPQPPEVSLKIFDVGGRIIRTLVNGHKPAGTYRIVWDGMDDSGSPVASGTYIARVSQWGMSGGDFPIKITLLK